MAANGLRSLPERMRSFPTPVAGLALGIASLGLSWENLLPVAGLAETAAVIAALLLILLSVRFALHPETLSRDLANPVVGGVVATYAMAWMLISISLWQISHMAWALLWLFGLGLHVIFLSLFVKNRMGVRFELLHMVPSWFVPPVGIVVAAVSYRGPHEGPLYLLAGHCIVLRDAGLCADVAGDVLPVHFCGERPCDRNADARYPRGPGQSVPDWLFVFGRRPATVARYSADGHCSADDGHCLCRFPAIAHVAILASVFGVYFPVGHRGNGTFQGGSTDGSLANPSEANRPEPRTGGL